MNNLPPNEPNPFSQPGQTDTVHRGTSAHVWRALDSNGLPVIIKQLTHDAQTLRNVARLRYELRILELLEERNVPHVPRPAGLREEPGMIALIMHDAGGIALRDVREQAPIDLKTVVHIGLHVAEALAGLHEAHIVHKDVNPANIILNKQTGDVQLIDFDLASQLDHEYTNEGSLRGLEGTLAYMSPEQTGRMNRPLDYRTDLYSLGATLYDLLAGRPPHPEETTVASLVFALLTQSPPPLRKLTPEVPEMVAQIIERLLAKVPEDRYKSARGVAADLRKCRDYLATSSDIPAFTLAQNDRSARFELPQKLYGRETEVNALMQTYSHAAAGHMALVFVSGPSGIGKSALVNALAPAIVQQAGLFCSGKYDQLQRNRPFSALQHALAEGVHHILMEPPHVIERVRRRLHEAVGNVGRALLDIVPSMQLLIGPQKALPVLGTQENENRLLGLLQRTLLALGKKQPLVLFLDDLQWADSGTLQLLERMASDTQADSGVLIIGSFRDAEVEASHPLHQLIERLQGSPTPCTVLTVAPLPHEALLQMLCDATLAPAAEVRPLSDLIWNKTGGSAFFVREFLTRLVSDELLTYHPDDGRWHWDAAAIAASSVTTHVAELLSSKLRALPVTEQEVLATAACLGNEFLLGQLAQLQKQTPATTLATLHTALEQGLVLPTTSSYRYETDAQANTTLRFSHDRIQQAAYALLDEAAAQRVHHAITTMLLKAAGTSPPETWVMGVINHANAARALRQTAAERLELASLNSVAGRLAAASMAYDVAENYLKTGIDLVGTDWQANGPLLRELHLTLAQVEFRIDAYTAAEKRLGLLLEKASSHQERLKLQRLRIDMLTGQARHEEAILAGCQALRTAGIHIASKPHLGNVLTAYLGVQAQLIGRSIDTLADAPPLTNAEAAATIDLLIGVAMSAIVTNPMLFAVSVVTSMQLVLRHGLPPQCHGHLGMALVSLHMGNHEGALQWAQVTRKLLHKLPDQQRRGMQMFTMAAFFDHLNKTPTAVLTDLAIARARCQEEGDPYVAANCHLMTCLVQGYCSIDDAVAALQAEPQAMQAGRANMAGLRIALQMGLCVQGRTHSPTSLSTDDCTEESLWAAAPDPSMRAVFHHQKLFVAWLHRDFAAAQKAVHGAFVERITETNTLQTVLFFCFHGALAFAQDPTVQPWSHLVFHRMVRLLRAVTKASPAVYGGMSELIDAELAGRSKRQAKAMHMFESASRKLVASGYPLLAATGYEAAARYAHAHDLQTTTAAFATKAREIYHQWGGVRKVSQLEETFSAYFAATTASTRAVTYHTHKTLRSTGTTKAGDMLGNSVDTQAIATITDAIAGEMNLDVLVAKLLDGMQQAAGATRAVLYRANDMELTPLAESSVGAPIPMEVLQYPLRTQEPLVVNRTSDGLPFRSPYGDTPPPKALLATPLMRQGKVIGIMYLENALSADTFGAAQVSVVKAVAAQAAVALENASMYAAMEEAIANRTAELQSAHSRVVLLERQTTEGQMAGGFAHEIRNALSGSRMALSSCASPTHSVHANTLEEELSATVSELAELAQTNSSVPAHDLEATAQRLGSLRDMLKESVAAVDDGIDRALLVARRTLEYAQVASLQPGEHSASLLEAVRAVIQGLRSDFAIHGTALQNGITEDVQVAARPEHVATILKQLLINANDAAGSPEQPARVRIEASTSGGALQLRIINNGAPVPEAVQSQLFQPFFSTKGAQGLGLGLGLSRKLAQVYGGNVLFDSSTPAGTIFKVQLPLSGDAEHLKNSPKSE